MKKLILIVLTICFITHIGFSQTANEIIAKMEKLMFINGVSEITIEHQSETFQPESYKARIYTKSNNQYVLVRFTAPSSSVGKDLLMMDKTVWLYDARSDRVIRVPSNQAFGNTGFSYGDVVRLNFSSNYSADIVSTNANDTYTMELKALRPDVPYYRVILQVSSEFIPIQGDFYSQSGEIIKTMVYDSMGSTGSSIKPLRLTVYQPLLPNEKTILTIHSEKLIELPSQIFNRKNLSAKLEEQYQ